MLKGLVEKGLLEVKRFDKSHTTVETGMLGEWCVAPRSQTAGALITSSGDIFMLYHTLNREMWLEPIIRVHLVWYCTVLILLPTLNRYTQ